MQGSMPMKGQSFISRFLREIELPESIRFCIWRLMASEEREADMNIQVRTSSGITLVPLETRLMAGRKIFLEGEIVCYKVDKADKGCLVGQPYTNAYTPVLYR